MSATIATVELRQLQYFITVAELLHFTGAARKLRIAQPPLSRQIQALEKELGVELFERRPGNVRLTQSGAVFLEEARAVLSSAEHAIDAARAASNGKRGIVRMGIALGLGNAVSRMINLHLRLHSNVELDVVKIPSGYQAEALISRDIDVGFMRAPIAKSHISSEKIFTERMCVVLPRSSPLAKFKRLTLKQIANERLLLINRTLSPAAYDKTLALLEKRGLKPAMVPTDSTPHDETGAILVASGKGMYVSIGSGVIHPAFADRLIEVPLAERDACVEAHVAWRTNEITPVVLDLVAFTQSFFKQRAARPQSNLRKAKVQTARRAPKSSRKR